MPTYGMAIDLNRCIGCYNCQVACKDEHVGNEFSPIATSQPTFNHFWMSIQEKEQCWDSTHYKVTYIPTPCNHCKDAECVKAGKNGAVYQREDGIVIIDPQKAVGQKKIVDSCPYGAIYWNEEKNVAQKCTFCAHLLDDGWTQPRCVQSCPMSCMYFGDVDDPKSTISKFIAANRAEVLKPEAGTNPKVSYVGLPKPHLAGTARFVDSKECAPQVKVTLTSSNGKSVETTTDCFGDFAFSDVKMGKYKIRLSIDGYKQEKSVDIQEDITDLGEIALAQSKPGRSKK
jgi:Fe-S-cluster-containing dehydrogenase component